MAGHRWDVRFDVGFEGVYSVEPERRGGVFLKIIDPHIFNAVTVNPDFGCAEWPGGIDLSPVAMYQAMKEYAAESQPAMMLRDEPEKQK